MKAVIALVLCLFSLQLHAQTDADYVHPMAWDHYPDWQVPKIFERPNPGSSQVCNLNSQDFINKAAHSGNLTPIRNSGGYLSTGLCWWHSRMQRSALYLAVFDNPTGPKPSDLEVSAILQKIYYRKSVVRISGFHNWYEFTQSNPKMFTTILSMIQINEGRKFEFLKGLVFNPDHNNLVLANARVDLNLRKRMPYLLVNRPGLGAHSWIVSGYSIGKATPWTDQRAYLEFIDSNLPDHATFLDLYKNYYIAHQGNTLDSNGKIIGQVYGGRRFEGKGLTDMRGQPINLVIQNESDYEDYVRAIENHCGRETPFTKFQKQFLK